MSQYCSTARCPHLVKSSPPSTRNPSDISVESDSAVVDSVYKGWAMTIKDIDM